MLENGTNFFTRTAFAETMRADTLVCLDVGARGGFEPDLLPLAFAVEAHGLEPDPDAFAAIKDEAGPWEKVVHHPVAVSGTGGPRTLYVTRDPIASSLLPFSQAMADRYGCHQYRDITNEVTLDTQTVPDLMASAGMARLDYLKLDVEGAEYEILDGARPILDGVSLAKIEVSFGSFRETQGQAADVATLMIDEGFFLLDMIRPARWRIAAGPLHPHMDKGFDPYSRGRLIQADYLFLREPATISDPAQARRCAFLAMAHGYFDDAKVLLTRRDVSETMNGLDMEQALNAAARAYGKLARRQAFKAHLRTLATFLRRGF